MPYKEGLRNDVFKIARFVNLFPVMLCEMFISKLYWMNMYTVKWVYVLIYQVDPNSDTFRRNALERWGFFGILIEFVSVC